MFAMEQLVRADMREFIPHNLIDPFEWKCSRYVSRKSSEERKQFR